MPLVMETRLVDLTPHVREHGEIRGRALAVAEPSGGPAAHADLHRETLESLRRLAVQLETAALLERRADRSADPSLAAVLRARADQRRRIAEQLREHLAGKGLPRTAGPSGADLPHP
jgi:hypothetical protein